MNTLTILASLVTIITGLITIYFIFRKKKYAVCLTVDANLINSQDDLDIIKETIQRLLNIKSEVKLDFVNKSKIEVKFSDKKGYQSFLKRNLQIVKTYSSIKDTYIANKRHQKPSFTGNEALINFKGSDKLPAVYIDSVKGIVQIKGKSTPENTYEFYKPLVDRLNTINQTLQGNKVKCEFDFSYFNSSTSKMILDIMQALKKLEKSNFELSVFWYFEYDDDDMKELGEEYQEVLSFKNFFLIPQTERQWLS